MAFKSLHHILDTLENRYQPREQQQLQQVIRCWVTVVGPVVAAQAQPTGVQRGVLRVATASSAWAQNLVFERQRILEKLNATLLFSLSDIRFSTAQWQPQAATRPSGLDDQIWEQHPSRIATPNAAPEQSTPIEPTDPNQAFQRWAQQMRSRSRHLPLCPHCNCPTPKGELERWNMCALCVAKRW